MGIAASYLGLFGAVQDGSASYLRTLYGQGGQTTRLSVLSPAQALRAADSNQARDVKRAAAQPEVKRVIDTFTREVAKATNVEQLLRNPAVMEVLLTANGLPDKVSSPALARKALLSDLDQPGSLANTLADSRWKSVVKTYDFAHKGLSVIQDPAVIAKLADAYAEVKWRRGLDEQTPGLSNALAFRAQAAKVTSVYDILDDPVLRDVTTTALRVPKQIAFQSLDAQVTAISTRLDIAKLQDPKFVDRFVQRYLVNAAENAAAQSTPDLSALAVKASGLVI